MGTNHLFRRRASGKPTSNLEPPSTLPEAVSTTSWILKTQIISNTFLLPNTLIFRSSSWKSLALTFSTTTPIAVNTMNKKYAAHQIQKSGNSSCSSGSAMQILLLFFTVRQGVLGAAAYFPVQKNMKPLSSTTLHISRLKESPDHSLMKQYSDSHSSHMPP